MPQNFIDLLELKEQKKLDRFNREEDITNVAKKRFWCGCAKKKFTHGLGQFPVNVFFKRVKES